MRIFDALGVAIESAWRAANYDELAFPAIAAGALREARIPEQIGADDVLRWLLTAESLPQQEDLGARFGEPPLTVHRGRRFQVQVLFWFTSSTSIHRHGFSGAFQVLQGGSLQSRYDFELRRRISSRFLIGDVRLRAAELLGRGDVVEIERDLTHCLFHLEAPSATIVVRTYSEPEAQPQYEYRPPSLAVDPFFEEPLVKRWLQGLELMIRKADPDYAALAADLIARSDLHTGFLVLEQAYHQLGDLERIGPLVEAAERRHGPVIGEITAALYQGLHRSKLARLRADVKEPESRFFLALLQNLPDKGSIYAMVRRRYPGDDPRARVIAWVRELSGVARIGVDFDDDLNGLLFEALLDGCPEAELLERLKAEFDAGQVDAQVDAIRRAAGRMRQTALAPLFQGGG
jgi:hypothetical protein